MGRGTIVAEAGDGLYTIELDYGQAEKVQRLATIVAAIDAAQVELAAQEEIVTTYAQRLDELLAEQDAAIDALAVAPEAEQTQRKQALEQKTGEVLVVRKALDQAQTTADLTRAAIVSAERAKQQLETVQPVKQLPAWCADYTEGATGEVATIEVPGEPVQVIVAPAAHAPAAADGKVVMRELMSPEQAFFNAAILPGWQRHMPTYRVGVISGIDYAANTCTVTLDDARSSAQSLAINSQTVIAAVPVQYMFCDASSFEDGDRVVVRFSAGWTAPIVIGYETNPKPCGDFLLATGPDGLAVLRRISGVWRATLAPQLADRFGTQGYWRGTTPRDVLSWGDSTIYTLGQSLGGVGTGLVSAWKVGDTLYALRRPTGYAARYLRLYSKTGEAAWTLLADVPVSGVAPETDGGYWRNPAAFLPATASGALDLTIRARNEDINFHTREFDIKFTPPSTLTFDGRDVPDMVLGQITTTGSGTVWYGRNNTLYTSIVVASRYITATETTTGSGANTITLLRQPGSTIDMVINWSINITASGSGTPAVWDGVGEFTGGSSVTTRTNVRTFYATIEPLGIQFCFLSTDSTDGNDSELRRQVQVFCDPSNLVAALLRVELWGKNTGKTTYGLNELVDKGSNNPRSIEWWLFDGESMTSLGVVAGAVDELWTVSSGESITSPATGIEYPLWLETAAPGTETTVSGTITISNDVELRLYPVELRPIPMFRDSAGNTLFSRQEEGGAINASFLTAGNLETLLGARANYMPCGVI